MYRQILSVHALYACCIYNTIARSAVLSFALVQCSCILLPVVLFLHIFSTFATFYEPTLCCSADPFMNDQNFVLSVLTLEELGATGNKGLAGLTGNPVLANGIAGLATSATAQATVQRMLLWQMRDYIVEPFGETVQQVFARVSALRDSLDGPQVCFVSLFSMCYLCTW